jgi:hypothetical protein
MVKITFRYIILSIVTVSSLLISVNFLPASDQTSRKIITLYPPVSDKVLFNPGMGVYIFSGKYTDPKIISNISNFANIIYCRFTWAQMEAIENHYQFEKVLGSWIRLWRGLGFRIAFGVMSTTTDQTATPDWVFKSGVQGVSHMSGTQMDPVYWDERYLDIYERFINALGSYLEGGKNIEFIDMRGIGVWGEMHLGLFIKGMWTEEELHKTGFTTEKYINSHKRMIEMYKKAFPNTKIFLNISEYDELADFAAVQGVGLRFDGLTSIDKYPLPKKVSKIFKKYGYNYQDSPLILGVPCNYEFKDWETNDEAIKKSLDIALKDPISYIHPTIKDFKNLSIATKNNLINTAKRIGYRFEIKSIKTETDVILEQSTSTHLPIVFEWINTGLAPCYHSYKIMLEITDHHGSTIYSDIFYPNPQTDRWLPNQLVPIMRNLVFSKDIKAGNYRLTVELRSQEESDRQIQIANKNVDKFGKIQIADFNIAFLEDGTKRLFIKAID